MASSPPSRRRYYSDGDQFYECATSLDLSGGSGDSSIPDGEGSRSSGGGARSSTPGQDRSWIECPPTLSSPPSPGPSVLATSRASHSSDACRSVAAAGAGGVGAMQELAVLHLFLEVRSGWCSRLGAAAQRQQNQPPCLEAQAAVSCARRAVCLPVVSVGGLVRRRCGGGGGAGRRAGPTLSRPARLKRTVWRGSQGDRPPASATGHGVVERKGAMTISRAACPHSCRVPH